MRSLVEKKSRWGLQGGGLSDATKVCMRARVDGRAYLAMAKIGRYAVLIYKPMRFAQTHVFIELKASSDSFPVGLPSIRSD